MNAQLQKIATDQGLDDAGQIFFTKNIVGKDLTFDDVNNIDAIKIVNYFAAKNAGKIKGDIVEDKSQTQEAAPETAAVKLEKQPPVQVQEATSVYDEETGKFVKPTTQEKQQVEHYLSILQQTTLVTGVVLKEIADNKLYLAAGYSSFKDFSNVALPFGERVAKRYLKIGRTFGDLFQISIDKGTSKSLLAISDNGETPSISIEADKKDIADKIAGLGLNKMVELTKLDDEDMNQLLSKEKITLASGEEITLDDIKQTTARRFEEQMKEHREYVQQLESELDKSEKAREKAEQEKQDMKNKAETGMKYRDMYASQAGTYEAYKSRITEARGIAINLNQALSQIKELPLEYDALVAELQDLHKLMHRGMENLRMDNAEAINR